jgi:hypothetical protein
MGGNFAAINVLVGATGPQDAMDRLGLVDQVMQKQQASVDEMVAARRPPGSSRTRPASPSAPPRTPSGTPRPSSPQPRRRGSAARAQAAVVALANSRRRALTVANSERSAVLASTGRPRRRRPGSRPRCAPGNVATAWPAPFTENC